MEKTNQELQSLSNILAVLPTTINGVKLAPATITKLILMRMEAEKLVGELQTKQKSILEKAKEGVEGFDEGIQAYTEKPEEHEDFKPIFDAVNEKFEPAWSEVLKEKVTLTRSFTDADILAFAELFDKSGTSTVDLPLTHPALTPKGEDKEKLLYPWPTEALLSLMAYHLL